MDYCAVTALLKNCHQSITNRMRHATQMVLTTANAMLTVGSKSIQPPLCFSLTPIIVNKLCNIVCCVYNSIWKEVIIYSIESIFIILIIPLQLSVCIEGSASAHNSCFQSYHWMEQSAKIISSHLTSIYNGKQPQGV